ncbi:MAG: 1-acyl-sn-glycerol-3-phosphate acyltransferase [Candidatus Kerfeldbacteria bacterium]|nr:1-acyl-sn-glycerol-3-phosphate acyltransferase [Candidatus Kerfeldbacteria bacterium]
MPVYRVLGRTLLPFLRWRISRLGGENNVPRGGFIVVANHQSWIDSAIVAAALSKHIDQSFRFVAQSSKYRFLGGIPINEYDKSKVIDVAAGYLRVGHPIIIFPEGNSNRNPELRGGKTGAARLALKSGAPVLPIGIHGTQGIKAWQSMLWFFSFWKPCAVTIGPPVSFPRQDLRPQDHERLMAVTDDIMRQISAVSGKPLAERPSEEPLPIHQPWLRTILHRFIYPMNRWRVEVHGQEHLPRAGPFIVAANHLSYYDAPALSIAVLKTRGLQPFYPTKAAVAAAFKAIVGQGGLDALGMLPLDERDRTKVLRFSERHLKSGGVIGIFPEGTRNKPKINPNYPHEMLPGKTGAARLFLATRAPIIPAAIEAPEGLSVWKSAFSVIAFWKKMRVTFGPPVEFDRLTSGEPTKDDLTTMTRTIMQVISRISGQSYPY